MRPLLFLSLVLPLAAAFNARRSALSDCLNAAKVPILLTSSPDWAAETKPFNLRITPSPAILAIPRSQSQLQSAVKCAHITNTHVSARAGGHSYGAFGLSGTLVVDLSEFQAVSYNSATKVVTIGAGRRLGNVAEDLFALGERALPHGTCPGVGLGGHATLGGFGLDSRMWGLSLDRVVALSAVLANGTAVRATSSSHPDLFWALRGAASSFAVVTNFEFLTLSAPSVNINWSYSYTFATAARATDAFLIAQKFGQTAPSKLGYGIVCTPGGVVAVRGVYYGARADFEALIAPLLASLKAANGGQGPTASVQTLGWLESLEALAGEPLPQPLTGYNKHDTFYAKSVVTDESAPLSRQAISGYFNYLFKPAPSGITYFVIVNLYGGTGSAINALPPPTDPKSTSSYAHRRSGYVWQLYASTAAPPPPPGPGLITFVEGMVDSLGPEAKNLAAYAPYADPQLSRADAQTRYWGASVPRLKALKKAFDPKGILYNPQGF